MSQKNSFTIAFTSCMSTDVFAKSQPVWAQIAEQQPDLLVLLGDSVYIDGPGGFDGLPSPIQPDDPHEAFAQHVWRLYRRQLAIPEFAALIAQTPTLAIWDDHDFLWNNADSRHREHPAHLGRMVVSANLFQCWRQALAGQPFPEDTRDGRIWARWSDVASQIDDDAAMPGYRCASYLEGQVWVHLTDGRSWRRKDKKQLLGSDQRQRIQRTIEDAPKGALHIIASGSTFSQVKAHQTESWQSYPQDRQWLMDLAARHRVLVLSGDVHELAVPAPVPCGGQTLDEAVASGAAVNFAPWGVGEKDSLGQFTEKFGLLRIDADPTGQVHLQMFDHGQRVEALERTWPRQF